MVVVEAVGGELGAAFDDTQEGFSEGLDPTSHGFHVAPAHGGRAFGMGVVKADHVAFGLFTVQDPGWVEFDTGDVARGGPLSPRVPEVALAASEEDPASFDYGFQGG